MELSKLKRVLIVRRNGLGDAVYTALAIKELKIKYPDIKFAILCSSYTKEIYNVLCPKIKKFVVDKEKYYGNFYGLFFHPVLKKIRKEKFDLAISSSGSYSSKSIYLLKSTGAKKISAVPSARDKFWNFFIDIKISIPKNDIHQIKKTYLIFKQNNLIFNIPKKFIPQKNVQHKILLCPQSSSEENQWKIENWIEIYKKLKKTGEIVNICLPEKSVYRNFFYGEIKSPCNTKKLIALINNYDLIITQEGGVGHIAAIQRKNLIVISNKSLRKRWLPWIEGVSLIESDGNINNYNADLIFRKLEKYLKKVLV